MPRHSAQDYADRCTAVGYEQDGMSRSQIAQALHRPERWVRRTFARYDSQVGLDSLRDRSSRPWHSPKQTPADVEGAICALKQAHPVWGRRQIAKQLRWHWRENPSLLCWVSEGRVRRVLARHPELVVATPPREEPSCHPIDYLECNLLWAADIHQTKLEDGVVWETLHWLDLHSRYELGQSTAARLTEEQVAHSFLQTAGQHGLPRLVKTDRDKLFYEASSGLPSLLSRVLASVGTHHLVIPKRQPWWNGVVERYIRTCRQEVELPARGALDQIQQAMEAERHFYNDERCHSRCHDQPPATLYQPSSRRLPQDFDLRQVPVTLQPTVVTRQVQAGGRVSLAGRTYPFSHRYIGQTIAVTVEGWQATAQAADGWQRTWDLHSATQPLAAEPSSSPSPKPVTRRVHRKGYVTINRCLYYVGVAWARQTLTFQPQGGSWLVTLPDGTTKTLPHKYLLPCPRRMSTSSRPTDPPALPPQSTAFLTRRVTKTGQITFHHHLYYVGIAHKGEQVHVASSAEGLAVYNADHAWITTCPWKSDPRPDKPLCPT
jgi:Homeodomain-like domain/Integrase core domain